MGIEAWLRRRRLDASHPRAPLKSASDTASTALRRRQADTGRESEIGSRHGGALTKLCSSLTWGRERDREIIERPILGPLCSPIKLRHGEIIVSLTLLPCFSKRGFRTKIFHSIVQSWLIPDNKRALGVLNPHSIFGFLQSSQNPLLAYGSSSSNDLILFKRKRVNGIQEPSRERLMGLTMTLKLLLIGAYAPGKLHTLFGFQQPLQ